MIGNVVAALIGLAVGGVICFFLGIRYRKTVSEKEISSAEEEGKRIINEAIKSAETKKKEALLEAKEEILKNRSEYEKEEKSRRADLQRQENRLQQKEENLDRKTEALEKREESLAQKHAAIDKENEEIKVIKRSQTEMRGGQGLSDRSGGGRGDPRDRPQDQRGRVPDEGRVRGPRPGSGGAGHPAVRRRPGG